MEPIKKILKEIIGFIFRFLDMNFFIREFFFRNKVTIIVYHNPSPKFLEKHLKYMSNYYNFIPLERLVNAIYDKDWSVIPQKSLVITFDDGYRDNYKLLGIFRVYNIHPTIYLCSHIINTKRKFWWNTGIQDYRKLKKYNNNKRLRILKNSTDYELAKEYPNRQALNLKEIREMAPFVDFQSHTKFHPVLTCCKNKESREEIEVSKNYLESLLNKSIKHFSYPNGDYTDREIKFLKKFGYKSGRTEDIGWNDIKTDPFKLKAMTIEDDASLNVFCAQISGFFGYIRYLRAGRFKGIRPKYH